MDYAEQAVTRAQRGKKHRRLLPVLLLLAVLVAAAVPGRQLLDDLRTQERLRALAEADLPDWVDVQIIPVDGCSRRGVKLEGMRDIVIHYVGNPGTTAQQNHDWYENPASEVSSHFLVGLDGEIVQCIPLDEKSSATGRRNGDTISIEVCHPDESGKFTDASYRALVKLTAYLEQLCALDESHLIRHYDVTGKQCPRWFVTSPDAWAQFKTDVRNSRP